MVEQTAAPANATIGAVNPARILVVGDAMLDRYWDGVVDRVSPEAPVPVLRVTRRYERPGGAANVAANLAALGAAVSLIALVGEDAAGARLESLMDAAGVAFDRVADAGYATIEKIRCVARHHQMLRADFEAAPPPTLRMRLAERFARALPVHDLVVLSDYAKGALADCGPLVAAARAAGKPVLVDPKGRDWARYAGATLLKPNLAALDGVLGEVAERGRARASRHGLARALRLAAPAAHARRRRHDAVRRRGRDARARAPPRGARRHRRGRHRARDAGLASRRG